MKNPRRTKQSWRFLRSTSQDAATNMAIDEAILMVHNQNRVPPTLRFYTWHPRALSIGYFQQVEKEIDLSAVYRYGLDLIRRPTGGRAVLHDQELTYSLIMNTSALPFSRSITESYRWLSTGLLHGFHHLGLAAHLALPEESAEERGHRSSACFDAPSRYELVVEGRKVAGSAQTRKQGTLLQHGSILLDLDLGLLFDLFHYPDERIKERLKASFAEKAVAINQLLVKPIEIVRVEEAFRLGFAEGLNIDLIEGELTKAEEDLVQELLRTKYRQDEWNYRR